MRSLLLVVVLLAVTAALEPFQGKDLHAVKRVSGPSSNDKHIVFASRFWDIKTGVATTKLRRIAMEPTVQDAVDLTSNDGSSDSSPIIVGDDVYFLSTRSGSSQLHKVPLTGTEAAVTQVSTFPVPISDLVIDPQGKFFLFSASVYLDCEDLTCTAKRDQALADIGPNRMTVYTKLFIRHWDTWETPGKFYHIFYAPLRSGLTENDVTDVLAKKELNSPVPPFGGAEQISIAPDGKQFALTVEDASSSAQAWTTGWDIYTVNVGDNGPEDPILITGYTSARTQNPAYAPSSKWLAYGAMIRPGYEADQLHVVLYDEVKNVTSMLPLPNFDKSVDSLVWVDDNNLVASADADGKHKLFLIHTNTSLEPEVIADVGTNSGVTSTGTAGEFVFTQSTWASPNEVFHLKIDIDKRTHEIKKISKENDDFLSTFYMARGESMVYDSNGTSVQAWYWEPFNKEAGKVYPIALLIHGGPQGAWNDGWSYRWNPQLWASRGYAVIAINPCGSTGFGQDVTDCVNGDWGGEPYHQIINGLNNISSQFEWMDGNNVCANGASYGGYMINWIAGNSPTRFKCLINHDGVFDTYSMFFTTEELWFTEWEFGHATPMENSTLYDKWNPARHADKWETPMLVVQGGHDFRVPIGQGIGTFTALQRQGIESKLLFLEMESHWVLQPFNGIEWYFEVLAWQDKYTSNTPPYTPALPERPSNVSPTPYTPIVEKEYSKSWVAPTILCVLLVVVIICLIAYIATRGGSYDRVN